MSKKTNMPENLSEDDLEVLNFFETMDKELFEENKNYSPSNPWDAPGMHMSDFIDFNIDL